MTLAELAEKGPFKVITLSEETDREISLPFCCDLLSWAMGRAPMDCAWVTVMTNMNTLAVSKLADTSCIIFAEGSQPDENMIEKARSEDITMLCSDLPAFETALKIHEMMK